MSGVLKDLKELLQTAKGERKADLIIKNAKIVNVYSEEIIEGNIVIKNGKIAAINSKKEIEAEKIYDACGQYALPGLMDAHVHIETTLLTPEALSNLIVPHGTTTMFVDAMEIANVAGLEGLKAMLKSNERLPYRIFLEVPSRVPTAPGLETTGGVLGVKEVEEILKSDAAVSLGELDPEKVLTLKEEYLQKIITAKNEGKIANGHAIGLSWDELNVYAAAGLNDDHECVEYEELQMRINLGMTVMVREGSTERNIEKLIKGVVQNNFPTEHLIFCTDDKHANEILEEGHINYNINKAISLGLNPIKAIKMATLNCARHFKIDHLLGSITPGRLADILFTQSLEHIKPTVVFKEGKIVSEKGKLTKAISVDNYPQFLKETVKIKETLSPESFDVKCRDEKANVRVINIYKDQIINFETIEELRVKDNNIVPDIEKDIVKLAVVERYGKNGNVKTGFVKGFGLKEGSLAISVSHDHHNIVVVGTNNEDMYLAVKEIEKHQGGMTAVRDGEVLGTFPLPIAGLMSDLPAEEVLEKVTSINEKVKDLGCELPAPFMTLSFISLPTVPELGLTDKGLIDVRAHKVIPVTCD